MGRPSVKSTRTSALREDEVMQVEAGRLVGAPELELAVHGRAVLGLMREQDVVLVALRESVGPRLAYSVQRDGLNLCFTPSFGSKNPPNGSGHSRRKGGGAGIPGRSRACRARRRSL